MARIQLRTAHPFRDRVRDPLHAGIDRLQRCRAIGDRHIGQIDIDREPRHVAHEQVDRSPALEREFFLRRDERHGPDQQRHLFAIIRQRSPSSDSGTVILNFGSSLPPLTSMRLPLPRSIPPRSSELSHGG